MASEVIAFSVNLRFTPENTKGDALTSRALKKECTFKSAYVVSSKEKTVNGKKVKIPIASYATATHQEGGE